MNHISGVSSGFPVTPDSVKSLGTQTEKSSDKPLKDSFSSPKKDELSDLMQKARDFQRTAHSGIRRSSGKGSASSGKGSPKPTSSSGKGSSSKPTPKPTSSSGKGSSSKPTPKPTSSSGKGSSSKPGKIGSFFKRIFS